MAEREHTRRTGPAKEVETTDVPVDSESGQELKSNMDDLLDEIDEVLETNAEEFVKSYIQKGGQ